MSSDRPVLPPPPADEPAGGKRAAKSADDAPKKKSWGSRLSAPKKVASSGAPAAKASSPAPASARPSSSEATRKQPATAAAVTAAPAATARTRTAHLRLTRIDPVSVMKMAFLLSIALGIVIVVAVTIIWSVLSAVGVWDNVNAAVQQVIGTESGDNFDVSKYIGTSRVIGFSLIASVLNVILLTAIATLAAFLYNLAAALLGGVEVTWAEDR